MPDDEPRIELPATGTGARAQHRAMRRRHRRVQEAWYVSAALVLAATIPVLGYIGYHNIVTSRDGRRVEAQNDPTKPNYEVNVIPTPVMLLEQIDGTDVTGLTMLSLGANDTGGGVLFIPVTSLTDDVVAASGFTNSSSSTTTSTTVPGTPPPKITLRDGYATKGDFALEQLTANVVGLSFDSVVALDHDRLTQYFDPVGPLTIDNPDKVVQVDAKGKTVATFPAGTITLQPTDVPTYLSARNAKESDLARLARQEVVWRAWLAAIKASSDPNVIPGETASGIGRYLKGLARGNARFATLPAAASTDTKGNETFVPDATKIEALTTTLVPLPTPANPGDEVRVRLLSGVGPLDANAILQAHLVPRDEQVTIVGNADRFDYTQSEIVYYDDQFAAAAENLKNQLGVGTVTKATTSADFEDVTLIIGKDLVDKQGLNITHG